MSRRLRHPGAEAEAALAAARLPCVVVVEDSRQAEVRFANNTTTTNGVRHDRAVSVVAFSPRGGSAVAAASISRGGAVDIAGLVAEAEREAEAAEPAEDAAELIAPGRGAPPADPAFDEESGSTELSVLAPLLGELGGAFERARGAGRVLAGFAAHDVTTTYLASSSGLRLRHVQPTGTLELVARSDDGSASSWAGCYSRDFGDVSLGELESRLVERLGWAARRRLELPAGRYETILPPDAVADLMADLYGAASGRAAEDGHSVFSLPGGGTRLGEQLVPLGFRLFSDPAAGRLSCEPFLAVSASSADVSVFDNGLSLQPTSWIRDGRLEHLRFHRAGAAAAGVAPAAPIDNLLLELPGASADLEDLIGRSERALLVTCLWYVRVVDPATLLLTGLTRDGVYLVENGEVVGAVNNFRFNESPLGVLGRTIEAGATQPAFPRESNEWLARTAMPALRVAEFNMSSVSPAS